jgi:putative hydrolase of the HAD superfamily
MVFSGGQMSIDWQGIDSVFLDMDGTLLDLHFDNHFWLQYVPERYAQARGLALEAARDELYRRYRDVEGTLDWYCVDHWSRELGLDIALLKEEVDHLIAVHPHVVSFLEALRRAGKSRVLVTNAHQKAISLKMERTCLAGHFDQIVCAHELGVPKEHPEFWHRFHAALPFDPERTLFVDDSPGVLAVARDYGIRRLLAVLRPDTRGPERALPDFDAIRDFSEVMPVA